MDPLTHVLIGVAIAGRAGVLPSLAPDVPAAALIAWQVASGRVRIALALAERWPEDPTRFEKAMLDVRRITHSPWLGMLALALKPWLGAGMLAFAAHIIVDQFTHGPGAWRPPMTARLAVWAACALVIWGNQ